MGLTHTDADGKAKMVDVGHKDDQQRTALAEGIIRLQPETIELIKSNLIKKGDVLSIAQIAGIQAAKQTPALIPLCHTLNLTRVDVTAEIIPEGVKVKCLTSCIGKTGVEMEALTGVNMALLTVYDMCKAVDKEMEISEVKLIQKEKHDLS